MDPLQWMGAVRMRVQTADKNITIIHTTPVHQLTSGEDKSWNKSIVKTFLTQIRVHNNASLQWKSASPVVSHIKIQPHICLQLFCLVNAAWSVQIYLLTQTRTLFHWRKHYYWLWSHILVTNVLTMDLFQLLSSLDVNWWTGMVWITCGLLDVFISCLDSHSDGTHSLQSIHSWDISPNLMKKQTHPNLGWPEGEHI